MRTGESGRGEQSQFGRKRMTLCLTCGLELPSTTEVEVQPLLGKPPRAERARAKKDSGSHNTQASPFFPHFQLC